MILVRRAPERSAYALRHLEHLRRLAAGHGAAVGAYATALLDTPLPWTKMRQVYALLGLVKRSGAHRVNAAGERALEAEAVNVGLIGRMLELGTEADTTEASPSSTNVVGACCARDPREFARRRRLPAGEPHVPSTRVREELGHGLRVGLETRLRGTG